MELQAFITLLKCTRANKFVMKNINGTGPINASCIERSGNIDHAATEEHTKKR